MILTILALGCAPDPACGPGTELVDGVCVAVTGDTDSDTDTEDPGPQEVVLFEETWDDTNAWDASEGSAGASACALRSDKFQQWLYEPSRTKAYYICNLDLIRQLDFTGLSEAKLTIEYDVSDFDAGGGRDLALVGAAIEDGSTYDEFILGWGREATGGEPESGTLEWDLENFVGWSEAAQLHIETWLMSCPNISDDGCGVTGTSPSNPDAAIGRLWLGRVQITATTED